MDSLQVVFLAIRHQAQLKLKEETVKRKEGECWAMWMCAILICHRNTIFCAFLSLEQTDHCWKRWWIQKYHRRWFTKAWTRTLGHLDGRYQPGLLQHQRTIIHIFFVFSLICFFKVLSDKALPVLCLFAILVYWTLGLSLPSTDNLLEEDVSDCVSLFWLWGSLDLWYLSGERFKRQ